MSDDNPFTPQAEIDAFVSIIATSAPAPFVFSIRKQYVDLILAGSKRWEFRTRRPSVATGDTALIYESRGLGRIVASFVVGRVIEGWPVAVRDRVEEEARWSAGIGQREYLKYFEGYATAVAIELLSVEPLDLPLPEGMRAPQSWARYKGPWP